MIREFVTIHRGTAGGGGLTSIGNHNLLMAYTHIAHDCHIGNETIFGNAATLAGHVEVEDYANVGAFSGVHQFCRVGKYAFIGGYSVVTKDALPFAKTVGNRARIYGINTIGLIRRGFSQDTIAEAAPRAPHPAALEHQPRRGADRARPGAAEPRGPLRRGFHPLVEAGSRPAPAEPPAGRSGRGVVAESDVAEVEVRRSKPI